VERNGGLFFMLSYVRRHTPSVAFGIVLLMAVDFIQIYIPASSRARSIS